MEEEGSGRGEDDDDSLTDDDDEPFDVEQGGRPGMERTVSCGRCGGLPQQEIEAGPSSAAQQPPQQQTQPGGGFARPSIATTAATTVQAAAAALAGRLSLQKPPLPPRSSTQPRRVIRELDEGVDLSEVKKPELKRGVSL
jgi:hypothetical protein